MARPLVATDVPGNRQLVEHGVETCLLCEARGVPSRSRLIARIGEMTATEVRGGQGGPNQGRAGSSARDWLSAPISERLAAQLRPVFGV